MENEDRASTEDRINMLRAILAYALASLDGCDADMGSLAPVEGMTQEEIQGALVIVFEYLIGLALSDPAHPGISDQPLMVLALQNVEKALSGRALPDGMSLHRFAACGLVQVLSGELAPNNTISGLAIALTDSLLNRLLEPRTTRRAQGGIAAVLEMLTQLSLPVPPETDATTDPGGTDSTASGPDLSSLD